MYSPAAFQVTDQTTLHDFIQAHSFGVLVSTGPDGLVASHLPFLLDRTSGECGALIGHVARGNSQWQHAGRDVLAIFSGPHAYISPTWYQTPNTVPTWNYVAVHASGPLELIEDRTELTSVLEATVARYEAVQPVPWDFESGSEFNQKLMEGIVGFRIPIRKLEGKWKLNQNHPVERRQRVMEQLLKSPHPEALDIARLMAAALPPAE